MLPRQIPRLLAGLFFLQVALTSAANWMSELFDLLASIMDYLAYPIYYLHDAFYVSILSLLHVSFLASHSSADL